MVFQFQKVKYRQEHKKIRVALRRVFGLGPALANQICDNVGLSNQRVKDLTPRLIDRLSSIVTNRYFVGPDLKKIIRRDIQRLKSIRCFRGRKK